MAHEYIYRENVPVYIDGADFGITCTLVRDRDVDFGDLPDDYGIIAFTGEQARFLADLVNTSDSDYLQGSFSYDAETDVWTEHDYDDHVYDAVAGFTVDGVKLYCLGADWCWSMEKEG